MFYSTPCTGTLHGQYMRRQSIITDSVMWNHFATCPWLFKFLARRCMQNSAENVVYPSVCCLITRVCCDKIAETRITRFSLESIA